MEPPKARNFICCWVTTVKKNRFCDFSVFRGSFYSVFNVYVGVSQPKYRIIRILSVMGIIHGFAHELVEDQVSYFILYNVKVRDQRA